MATAKKSSASVKAPVKASSAHNHADNLQAEYDVVISGGGIVGCLMAIALAKHTTFSVLLLEANTVASVKAPKHAGFDARVIALAAESLNLLTSLGVDIGEIRHQAIQQIHVSDKGHLGQVKLDASTLNISALGWVVALEDLGKYLLTNVFNTSQVAYACSLKITKVEQSANKVSVTLSNQAEIKAKLLVISDGGQSETASLAGITTRQYAYDQTAIITNVKTQLAHNNVAYERFTSQGPIAFLPMNTTGVKAKGEELHSMSVVWCIGKHNAEDKLALSDADFLQQLNVLFGSKLGKFTTCSERFSYPLSLMQSSPFGVHRAITVGNAAQTLHPIAGQGFNLGIRDVSALVEAIKNEQDPGEFASLNAYKTVQKQDKSKTINATNMLVHMFSNQYLPLVVGRNIGLLGMNASALLKQQFANFAMGNRG